MHGLLWTSSCKSRVPHYIENFVILNFVISGFNFFQNTSLCCNNVKIAHKNINCYSYSVCSVECSSCTGSFSYNKKGCHHALF